MPHQFMTIECKKCGEYYCPVCKATCPKCGGVDITNDKTMIVREQMRKLMKPKNNEIKIIEENIERH